MLSVFISGGSSGLGEALAHLYLSHGWKVGICGRDIQKLAAFKHRHPECFTYQADVSSFSQIQKSLHQFQQDIAGPLAVIIANAGTSQQAKGYQGSVEENMQMMQTNYLGVVNLFEAAIPIMEKQGFGRLMAISSLAGFNGMPGSAFYSSSKAAVRIYCESRSLDLSPHLSVSCICPGYIQTPLTENSLNPMPFIMSPQRAAEKIFTASLSKKKLVVFPLPVFLAVRFLSILPRSLYAFLAKALNLKV